MKTYEDSREVASSIFLLGTSVETMYINQDKGDDLSTNM